MQTNICDLSLSSDERLQLLLEWALIRFYFHRGRCLLVGTEGGKSMGRWGGFPCTGDFLCVKSPSELQL